MTAVPKRPADILTRHLSGTITRIRAEGDQVDNAGDAVRYEFTASTDGAVQLWGNTFEILDHKPESVRMGWFQSGNAPALWMHDRSQPRGIIEGATLTGNKITVTVRMSPNEETKELIKDIDAGIIRNVSIGYRVFSEVLDSREVDEEGYTTKATWRVTDWEPKEISFVTIPADTATGFGRDADAAQSRVTFLENKLTDDFSKRENTMSATITSEEANRTRDDAVASERERISGIYQAAAKAREKGFGDFTKRADEAVANKESLDVFQRHVLDNMERTEVVTTESLGLTDKEKKRYSLENVLYGLVEDDKKRFEFEREVSEATRQAYGHGDSGRICVPADMLMRGWVPRNPSLAMRMGLSDRERTLISVSASTANVSNLVERTLMTDMFIESLRENSVLLPGVTMLPGLTGDVSIPIELTSPQFFWIGEDLEPTEGEWTAGQVNLGFKTLAARIPLTRRASKQSMPSIEGVLARNLRKGVSLALEKRAWFGVGSSTIPTGILSTSGIGDVATGGTLAFAHVLELRSDVATANAPLQNCQFFTNSIGVSRLRGTAIAPEDAKRVGEYVNGVLYVEGKPVGETNLIPATLGGTNNRSAILFGDPESIYIGMWGGVEIDVDLATKAPTGGKVIRVFQDADIKLPQPARWSAIQDLL